jgi:CheY-like chemotaxis protein
MHGGTVVATSDGAGAGSEFTVRLPLAPAEKEEVPASMSVRSSPPGGGNIVIVEDNADSRELLYELLVGAGFQCQVAATGTAALTLIDECLPDIAILDVGLPEIDGFELARRLRRNPKHDRMRLIAMTGYGRAADRAMAKSVGFDQHLVKPVDAMELLALLGRMRALESERPRDLVEAP